MATLIDDLLALSRVTRSEFRRERVDLSEIAQAIVERLRQTQPERSVEITIAEGLVEEADPHLLVIVLENLLGNAWKYTGKRAQTRIEVGASLHGSSRAFFVRDNGAGFDMAYASKLFGVFQRLHSPREFEGTGIGLATVQRIIRRHGGRIWAEAEVDRGATFHFALSGGPHSNGKGSNA
jgi:light-regulated signal transduction histidine kinase (bacteriophytochrome)